MLTEHDCVARFTYYVFTKRRCSPSWRAVLEAELTRRTATPTTRNCPSLSAAGSTFAVNVVVCV
ncbi:hypothetical protein ACFU6M_06675 [Streptomyces bottropensis]|uniref:hypothetical protein n=1 Tax=Streptomyces bottropensis TaxID=42235 RepID=UPI0036BD12E2